MASTLINLIPGIEGMSYLELGIADNTNFNRIACADKFSVDINGNAMFTGTTDDFFLKLNRSRRFDFVYIDANHDLDYVVRDFNNSVAICDGWVLIHDMFPPDEAHTDTRLCSDSYKLLFYLVTATKAEVYTLDSDYGLTFVRMPAQPVELPKHFRELSYANFLTMMDPIKFKRYSTAEISKILRGD